VATPLQLLADRECVRLGAGEEVRRELVDDEREAHEGTGA
jgi:hypothetical protein